MKIVIAKTAGFCMGVRRAVEMVLDAPSKHPKPIYTYGPLIHNPQVLNLLEEKGITILDKIPESGSGTVLIRAHGVPPQTRDKLEKAGFKVIDATCPRVISVQTIIKKHALKDYEVIILGNENHPEVIGLKGFANGKAHVISHPDELSDLPEFKKAIVVAQTTQNVSNFDTLKEKFREIAPHYKIFNTICDSTQKRQAEVVKLADTVDAVIVAGGKESGNTRRLAEIARQSNKPVLYVETADEIDIRGLQSLDNIGITAGASTPNWIIKRIYRSIEKNLFHRERGIRKIIFTLKRTLLLTNIYISLGAGCLCFASLKLLRIPVSLPYILIAVLYIQSMHMLNNLTGKKADRYNDPDRANFYDTHQVVLGALAVFSGGAGLILAFMIGPFPFIILILMSLLGLSYNLSLPPSLFSGWKIRSIRDIPGSKTILISLAWGVVTSVYPHMTAKGALNPCTMAVFAWSTSMAFIRSAFFDILDMQGDRIVGKETIPLLLGEKKALLLLKIMLFFSSAILLIASAVGMIPGLGFLLLICPVYIGYLLNAYEKGRWQPGIRLEFLIETQFVLAGMITLIWSLI